MLNTRSFALTVAIALLAPAVLKAEVTTWQLGGSQPWAGQDTVSIMIDFERVPSAIQPVRVEPGVNIISLLDNWTTFRQPKELGYIDGERPRIWKWNEGNGDPTENGVALIDADSTTYNSSKAEGIGKQFFTIDLAVPMPAHTFGFHAPSGGFRSDGTPLRTDSTPAFQISIQEENSEIFAIKGPLPLARIVAEPTQNFAPDVRIGFDQQYVRFFRWARKFSIIDETALSRNRVSGSSGGQGNQARSLLGTISEFEIYGEGFPKRATYRSKIIDLGAEQNFGRLFFTATPLRFVAGEAVEAPDARAFAEIEVRTGRDDDPNIYHEYTVTGKEKVVSRARYENDLRTGFGRTCASCDFVQRSPRPGMRAAITYDSDNWTFWSTPITQSGLPLNLDSGSFIQVFITLHSTRFADFVRLDSLWVERAPLLAARILGEVAPLADPQPVHGFGEVALGEMVEFAYDLSASFSGGNQRGFDQVRIHTGAQPAFKELLVGGQATDPAAVREEDDGLTVVLPERVTRANNAPLRIIFSAEVFELATTFLGTVTDSEVETLPQPIVSGDASELLSTNSLRVLSVSDQQPALVQNLRFSTPVLTPNSDGVHDELRMAYSLYGLPEQVPVELAVYALDGRHVATVSQGLQTAGPQTARWDGRDAEGATLPPGVYLISVVLQSERRAAAVLRPVGVAY
jgi:hypothetical protein